MDSFSSRLVSLFLVAFGVLFFASPPCASQTVSVTVPGTACPWLAGMPNGTVGIPYQTGTGNDVAPDESPVQVTGITVAPGRVVRFSATGLASFVAPTSNIAPDGNASLIFGTGKNYDLPDTQPLQSFFGMSGVYAPATSLLGVFLSDSRPDTQLPPAFTDYTNTTSRDFSSFTPLLQQVFYIGDGRTTTGVTQTFTTPQGATRLYLAVMDGYQWSGNPGSFNVTVVDSAATPEPTTLILLVSGLSLFFIATQRALAVKLSL